jgi:hypothetical protein
LQCGSSTDRLIAVWVEIADKQVDQISFSVSSKSCVPRFRAPAVKHFEDRNCGIQTFHRFCPFSFESHLSCHNIKPYRCMPAAGAGRDWRV